MLPREGIDVSSHQGDVDFKKVKAAGKEFVIIKAGQHFKEMSTFKNKYLPAVLDAGLDWGAYWWSDAITVAEAKREADCFLRTLDGLQPTYPVYMDQEYASPCGTWGVQNGKQLRTNMAKAFLDALQTAGYYAGLYASTDWLHHWVDYTQLNNYDKWVAQYASSCTYKGTYGMWQHHGDVKGFIGKCDGVNTNVDLNTCFKDYPTIIKNAGLNGWKKPTATVPPAEPVQKFITLDELKQQGYTGIIF